jgi:hypothetical protein
MIYAILDWPHRISVQSFVAAQFDNHSEDRFESTASVERSRHVGFAPNSEHGAATQLTDASGHVWTAPSWQGESSRRRLGRCSHVFGL